MSCCGRRPRPALPGVIEGGGVATSAAIAERESAVLDDELVGHELLAGALVPGDDAGHRLRPVVAIADAYAHAVSNAQPLATLRVGDLDVDGTHRHELA